MISLIINIFLLRDQDSARNKQGISAGTIPAYYHKGTDVCNCFPEDFPNWELCYCSEDYYGIELCYCCPADKPGYIGEIKTKVKLNDYYSSNYPYGQALNYLTPIYELENLTLPIPTPNIYNDNIQLNKIKASTKKIHNWIPHDYINAYEYTYSAATIAERYFSINLCFQFTSDLAITHNSKITYRYIYNTIDLNTGELLNLSDIIDLDQFLDYASENKIIKLEGFLTDPYPKGEAKIYIPKDDAALRERFYLCAQPFNEDNYKNKPVFYIKENMIYFVDIFYPAYYPSSDEISVAIKDIEHLLKIDIKD